MIKLCKLQNVNWTFRKESFGFFFEFIRSNDPINAQNDPINDPINEECGERDIFSLLVKLAE